jgi:hypothetical protein
MNASGSRRFGSILVLALGAGLLAGGCGEDSSSADPGWPGYTEGPNEGRGWVGITYPYGPVETSEASVDMGGTMFIPDLASCPAWTGDLGRDYHVIWSNDANGKSGPTQFGLNCVSIVFAWWKAPPGLIGLEPGVNHITITASDERGNIGRATLTVNRK